MLTEFLAQAVAFVLGTALQAVEGVVPEVVFDWLDGLASNVAYLLSFGPASAIAVIVGAYYAVDLAINAYVFAVTTYKLIPAKAT
jgi:hypothetical protein